MSSTVESLKRHWSLLAAGAAALLGAAWGAATGIGALGSGRWSEGAIANFIGRLSAGSPPAPAVVVGAYIIVGAASGFLMIGMPILSLALLLFRRSLQAAGVQSRQRLKREMAAIAADARGRKLPPNSRKPE